MYKRYRGEDRQIVEMRSEENGKGGQEKREKQRK